MQKKDRITILENKVKLLTDEIEQLKEEWNNYLYQNINQEELNTLEEEEF